MTARRGEESQERVVFSVQCSGQSSLHLLLDILGLKVPLDVDHSDVDHAEHKHAAPETGAAPDNGLHVDLSHSQVSGKMKSCSRLTFTSGVAQRLVKTFLTSLEMSMEERILL